MESTENPAKPQPQLSPKDDAIARIVYGLVVDGARERPAVRYNTIDDFVVHAVCTELLAKATLIAVGVGYE